MVKKYLSFLKIKLLKLIIYGICCMGLVLSRAQEGSFVSQYLLSAAADQKLEQFQAELDFLNSNSMRPSLLRETEVRIASKGFNTSVEDYRLRISPTNPWEISANRDFQKQLTANTHTRYRIALGKALKTRYSLLIKSHYLHELSYLTQEDISYRKNIARQLINQSAEDVDLEDIIGMEAALSSREIALAELEVENEKTNQLIGLDMERGDIQWAGVNLISPATIAQYLERSDSTFADNLYKLQAAQKLQLEEKMYRVSRTEAFSNMGFLQANYETDRGDELGEHLGFQVGISLPIFNRDRADLARDRFELIEVQKEKELTESVVDQQVHMLRGTLSSNLKLYELIRIKLDRMESLKPALSTSLDLAAYLKYSNYHLELRQKQTEVHYKILKDFIELLDLSGELGRSPIKNYLVDSMPPIEEW